ncbi:VanZ family protein [Ekhidna sp.]|uniref:VanZ family protein n=1 Tax=Ekhidna sp. TaxID=2608089 RepID=UPI00329A5EDB
MNSKTIWFIPAAMVALGIFLLSTFLSLPIQVDGVGYLDKIEHCFAYFVLIVSFLLAFRKAELLTPKRSIYLLIGASVYGFGLEMVQFIFFDYRYFEWVDALANVFGVLVGFVLFKLIYRG